ncbi:hypothetical protein IE81DRAFT_286321 [Ceraceosorus guamensis]|uniref:Amino-acid acetyltransferase, mitochondrial n=1 Tax=Ceraceosorus guamensis TaxID=1522189 RepID=A0A316W4T9_9BASI|nr:hypothetical protein IE81DRAFT_286321 [Ceraceosorus guamensis]PWN44977.1 hypothetical protein IE81DRAFT_286321 [Ceraceosorus guamensis]
MQSLILEILNAQPSLRDSKTYLNSFAPRTRQPSSGGTSRQLPPGFLQQQQHQQKQPNGETSSSAGSGLKLPNSFQVPPPPIARPANPNKHRDDVNRPEHLVSRHSTSQEQQELIPAKDGTEAALQPELSPGPITQQHTALVKVQGPFTDRQLESIAEGMVYLKKLGLVSVIVMDSEEATWSSGVSHFASVDGRRLDASEMDEVEEASMAPWLGEAAVRAKGAAKAAAGSKGRRLGLAQEALRKRLVADVYKLSELLSQKGAPARPFPQAIMRVDAEATASAQGQNLEAKASLAAASSSSSSVTAAGGNLMSAVHRSPVASDDDLSTLRSALASDQIPVLAPLALYSDPEEHGAERTVCVSADDVLVGLARDMSAAARAEETAALQGQGLEDGVDMMPLRLMVINREGGIPSHARGGNPHLSINLASEYAHIRDHFVWSRTHPTALSNLAMVQDCLSYMPHSSSGVVVSHRSPRSLIANLITNKAAHSPSLPHRLLASRKDVRHTPTIIRPGLDVRVLSDFAQVDQHKLTALLEASFGRKLDAETYYARLTKSCDFVIVTGDYQGAAIVTREMAPTDVEGVDEPIAYLDKFAVLPSLQGSGTVDFLWGALRDEVHGLGLLDALNDNGGAGGFGTGRDLVWKSRADNPVNRWYYERSNGFMRIDTRSEAEKKVAASVEGEDQYKPAWSMFWCDAEDRISRMAGERRLGAEASAEDVLAAARLHALAQGYEEDDEVPESSTGAAYGDRHDHHSHSFEAAQRDPSTGRLLSELDPRPGGAGAALLPIVAPEESGRLQRWAACMATIPTAWA